MRQRIYAGLLLTSSLFLTVHCGSDDGSDNDDTSSGGSGGSDASGGSAGESSGGSAGAPPGSEAIACPDDIEDMPAKMAEAICWKRVECCVTNVDTCIAEVLEVLGGMYPDLDEAEDRNTASLDCSAFDACAVAIHEASCSEWPFQVGTLGGLPVDEPACLEIITPTASDGEECRYNYECVDGVCRVPEGDSIGACHEFANVDDSCDDVCNPVTMFCDEANLCQARLSEGASCTAHDQCESRLCAIDGTGECIAPGPNECAYVPNGTAHCAVAGTPGALRSSYGLAAFFVLAGLGVRRRRVQRRPVTQ